MISDLRFPICDLEESPHPENLPEHRDREGMGIAIAGSGLISVFGDLQLTWEKLVAGQFISDHAKADRGVVELAQDAAHTIVRSLEVE